MAESTTTSKTATPTAPTTPSGPKTGDIVLVRQDIRTIIPGIVTNDYAGQNTAGVVAVVTFTAQPYGAGPVNMVPNCQPETKDTTAEDLQSSWQGYYMKADDTALRQRDLQKELDEHKAAQNPPAQTTGSA